MSQQPPHLPNEADRKRLTRIGEAFQTFEKRQLRNSPQGEPPGLTELRNSVRGALLDPPRQRSSTTKVKSRPRPGSALYAGLKALLGYYVDLASDQRGDDLASLGVAQRSKDSYERDNQEQIGIYRRLGRVEILADILTETLCEGFGEKYFDVTIDFVTVSDLKQAYWSARRRRTQRQRPRHPTHRVIRINDIPFAEAVYPELMSIYANELGYTIEVIPNIEWSEVGAALFTGRIDVAIYNGSIKNRINEFATLFDHKIIYKSEPLFRYKDYIILENTASGDELSFGVPWKSDFEDVFREHWSEPKNDSDLVSYLTGVVYNEVVDPARKLPKLPVTMRYCDSADQALQRVIDGHMRYCLVGGLQARYADSQFGGRSDKVKLLQLGHLNRATQGSEDDHVRFWVAVDRKDQADTLLHAMAAIWNSHVVRQWDRIARSTTSTTSGIDVFQDKLVELVNAYPHQAFVKNFGELTSLVRRHDTKLLPVASVSIPVKLGGSS
jgi:hypothetical protein